MPEAVRPSMTRRALALCAIGLLAACTGPAPDPAVEESLIEAPTDGIQLVVSIDHFTYAPGDRVAVRIQLVNRTEAERTLTFPTSQRYELIVRDPDGAELSRWGADTMFLQVVGEEVLAPLADGPAWEEAIGAPEAPGDYAIEVEVVASEGDLVATLPFEVRTDAAAGTP